MTEREQTMVLRQLDISTESFFSELDQLLAFNEEADSKVNKVVDKIIAEVKNRGNQALIEYTNKFDNRSVSQISDLIICADQLEHAFNKITEQQRKALAAAAQRIQSYHRRQRQDSWQYTETDGTVLGQKVTPLDRVGIYVPGGKASYPSSVLMNGIPAKVAGVEDITMVAPAPAGEINLLVLAAAHIVGINNIYTIGGAQAIAALACGTETITKVDKIVGPGNSYVAAAKRAVFGKVAIDMIAGPSEILVVCNGGVDPDWIAMDLFSQAEHDEQAQSILISTDSDFLQAVADSVEKLLPTLERRHIVRQSLANRGALIKADNRQQVIQLINRIAPEHLQLAIPDPKNYLDDIRHAGAIFLGYYTAEALGDYCAGPSHVLPTSGTARFSSPLGVYDFQKRSSIIHCSAEGANTLGKIASELARGESLEAHARSADYRVNKVSSHKN